MTDEASHKTLYLIDGHAQFFRAYYAIRSGMTSPVTKEPTNMTFGFIGMILKLLRDYKPDYLAVVIDVSGDRESFRSEIFPEYKANREPAPDDFHPQVERCVELLKQMHIPVHGEEGVEADDVIATIARRITSEHPDLEVRIVSKDKDLAQLLTDRIHMIDVHKDELVDVEALFSAKGVRPDQVIDMLTLTGDTVDNVPGVAGIGPKTAAKLIQEYDSLDNLLTHLDEIKGKRRENLEAAKDVLPLSKQLITLKDDVEVDFALEDAEASPKLLPVDDLVMSFRELGFNRLQDEIRELTGQKSSAQDAAAPEDSLFAQLEERTPGNRSPGEYSLITTRKDLEALVKAIREAGIVAIDTETDGLQPVEANLCGVCISIKPDTGVYIPTRSPSPDDHLDTATVLDVLRPVLEDDSIRKIGHNLKFDINVFRKHGVTLCGVCAKNHSGGGFDTMIASYVIDATRSSHKMDVLALALLDHTCIPISDLIGKGKSQRTFDTVPLEQAAQYAAEDADITYRLHEVMAPQIETMGLQSLFDDVEMPLVEVLAELEFNGIRVDRKELDRQREKLGVRIEELRRTISGAAPHPFSPDSPKQLGVALFNKADDDPPGLGLKVVKRGKTGPSTDQEVLEKLAADPDVDSTVPTLILEYRQLTKLVNTYLVSLAEAVSPSTGRVHASFHQTVASTGRLSSSDPNLQNIPIRTDVGREIRRAFVAEQGNVLITADYSQIELRILAHLSGDPALIKAFHEGQDIHVAVAAEVYGVELEEVTRLQRDSAKMVNFGIVYGITPFGLSRRLGSNVSIEDAGRIIVDYKKRFSSINVFLEECITTAQQKGYVETILKRRRMIPQIQARHPQQRALGERVAINSVVQGSAADLIKLAMIDLYRSLPDAHPDVRMLLQIHDELVFEAPLEQAEAVAAFVAERMSGAMGLAVPLVVDTAWSENWIDAK